MDFDALGAAPGRRGGPSGLTGRGEPMPIGVLQFGGEQLRFKVPTNTSRLDRLLREAPTLPQAAAWSNVVVAERALGMALSQFGAEIYAWLRDPGPLPFIRDFTAPFNVGVVQVREQLGNSGVSGQKTRPLPTANLRFMLRTSPRPPGFVIDSAAPLPPFPERGVASQPLLAYESRSPATERTRGHTVGRHVGHSVADAVARLRAEPLITADGCFDSAAVANQIKAEMVAAYGREIAGWLVNSGDWMPFTREIRVPREVGWVLDRNEHNAALAAHREPRPARANGARIVLRKSNDFPEGYYVLTLYPLAA